MGIVSRVQESAQGVRSGRRRTFGASVLAAIAMALIVSLMTVSSVMAAPAPINMTSSSCPSPIKYGQVSGCVTELQLKLNLLSWGLVVDGSFGPKTLTAVKGFQSTHGLVVDGLVGPLTKAALYAAVATPAPVVTATPIPNDGGYIAYLQASASAAAAANVQARRARLVNIVNAEANRVPTVLAGSSRQAEYAAFFGWSASLSWCAIFASWSAWQAGATTSKSTAVLDWVTWARNSEHRVYRVSSPLPGDLVAYDWGGQNDTDFDAATSSTDTDGRHIGVVTDVSTFNIDGKFTTVEGNTSNPAGGKYGVFRKSRSSRSTYYVLFIRFS